MGLKNRSRLDIYFDILSAARQSVRKTHIMYRSNLSYKQLDIYLDTLSKCNLIEEKMEDGAKVYGVTNKGLDFIELFENLSEYLTPRSRDSAQDLPEQSLPLMEKQPFVY